MYKLLILFAVFCLYGCGEGCVCVIEGQLPDSRYEGEWIYLVPLQNATADRVDSARIEKDGFRLEYTVESDELFILRMRPLLRLSLQELLVVVEPGQVHARIDSVSSAGGTPLNEQLQQWKEQQMRINESTQVIRQMLEVADDSTEILAMANRLKTESVDYNYKFVKQNRENVLGTFVYAINKSSFSPEQRKVLQMPE